MTDNGDALGGGKKELDHKVIPEDAFISPDEPMVPDKFREAFISPEEPLEPREEEGGIVVGMDGSTEHDAAGAGAALLDPERVAEVLEAVLADVRASGIKGLRAGPGASTFEKDLRIHLGKYFSRYRG